MSDNRTEIDLIGAKLSARAKDYAAEADALASDPYFKEAIMKVSVSGFVWALYHQFKHDPFSRETLWKELNEQSESVKRLVEGNSDA